MLLSMDEEFAEVTFADKGEVGEYYFETDPLALKGNSDYHSLLHVLVKLQAQRVHAVHDIECLQEFYEKALQDPLGFVTALQNGEELRLPAPQDVVKVPSINWDKYNVQALLSDMRPATRKYQPGTAASAQGVNGCSNSDDNKEKVVVRGRVYTEAKPQTFNQPWTEEEQRKLEELLIKHPEEPFASQRWLKISKELGTRTPLQVQSRVQKYFIALKREGFPIPGRGPSSYLLKGSSRKKRLHNRPMNISRSLFMKAYCMDADVDTLETSIEGSKSLSNSPDVSDEEDVSLDMKNSLEYQELLNLKWVKALKEKEKATGIISHLGYSCDCCGEDPIIGARWHCTECPAGVSVDLCGACSRINFVSEFHLPSHSLQEVTSLSIRDTGAVLDLNF